MANFEHPIEGLMNVTLEKIRQMVDSNTIIGNPIHTADNTTILPVSRVSFGFTSGGSDFASAKSTKDLFGGGSGAGVSMVPVGFLVLQGGSVRFIQIADKNSTVDRALNMLPDVVDKISAFAQKGKKDKAADATAPAGEAPPAPAAAAADAEEVTVTCGEPSV